MINLHKNFNKVLWISLHKAFPVIGSHNMDSVGLSTGFPCFKYQMCCVCTFACILIGVACKCLFGIPVALSILCHLDNPINNKL